jgi:hypothetical protein
MWDERATMHRGAGDSNPEERRVMLRTIAAQPLFVQMFGAI